MNNTLAVATLVALVTVSNAAPVWGADAATDTEQVKQQALAIPNLQQAAASAAGYKSTNIKVTSTAHQVTIQLVSSKASGADTANRKAESATIVSAIAKAIIGKPEFAQVVTMHVDYVNRLGNGAQVIEGFDFHKTANGAFAFHQT